MWDLIVSVPDHCLSFNICPWARFFNNITAMKFISSAKNNMLSKVEFLWK